MNLAFALAVAGLAFSVARVLVTSSVGQTVMWICSSEAFPRSRRAYGKGTLPATPFREDQPRLDLENFYYAQEDEVFAAAERDGFGWSAHRPHTIIGYALGNAMNMGVTLAVYATICRETERSFSFPGSAAQWNGLTDMTDARLLARHLECAATTDAARNQAFNVVNGDVFRWSWMWTRLAN